MSLAAFLEAYPEFAGDRAPTDLITSALARATARCDAAVFGDLRASAIGALAAHLLVISPWGQQARLVASGNQTTYERDYIEIRAAVAGGAMVRAL